MRLQMVSDSVPIIHRRRPVHCTDNTQNMFHLWLYMSVDENECNFISPPLTAVSEQHSLNRPLMIVVNRTIPLTGFHSVNHYDDARFDFKSDGNVITDIVFPPLRPHHRSETPHHDNTSK